MKKVTLLFVLIILCLSSCVTAIAHPGNTDGNGGHYDNSTGEYHYHHGYPAHQHDDMDGDGIPDCPYDDSVSYDDDEEEYDSSTAWDLYKKSDAYQNAPKGNSGSSNQSSTQSPAVSTQTGSSSNSRILPISLVFLGIIAVFVIIHYVKKIVIRRKQRELLKEGIPKLKQDYESLISDYHNLQRIYRVLDLRSPEEVAHVPADSYLDDDGLPRQLGVSNIIHDRYYLFVNLNTGTVHRADCRYGSNYCVPINICDLRKYTYKGPYACHLCHPTLPDISWVMQYKIILSGLELLNPGITERHQILRKNAYQISQEAASKPAPKKLTAVYAKAANGMTVRVPIDKLDAWKAEQAKLHHDNFLSEPPVPISFENRNIDLYHVKSTCISHAGYDSETGCLFLRMKDTGYLYMYKNVPQIIFRKIRTVNSVGRFYNRYIKGRYSSQRLNDIDIPCFHEEE